MSDFNNQSHGYPLPLPPAPQRSMGRRLAIIILLSLPFALIIGFLVWYLTGPNDIGLPESAQAITWRTNTPTLTELSEVDSVAIATPIPTETPLPSITPTPTATVPDFQATLDVIASTGTAVAIEEAETTEIAHQNELLETQVVLISLIAEAQYKVSEQKHAQQLRHTDEAFNTQQAQHLTQQASERNAETDKVFIQNLQAEAEANAERLDFDNELREITKTGITVFFSLLAVAVGVVIVIGTAKIMKKIKENIEADEVRKAYANVGAEQQENRDQKAGAALQLWMQEKALAEDLIIACLTADPKFAQDFFIPRYDKINMSSEKRQKCVEVLVKYDRAEVLPGVGTRLKGGTLEDLHNDVRTGDFPPMRPSLQRFQNLHAEHRNTPNSSEHSGTPKSGASTQFYKASDGKLKRIPGT